MGREGDDKSGIRRLEKRSYPKQRWKSHQAGIKLLIELSKGKVKRMKVFLAWSS